jgi:hypothetical protein
MKFSIFQVWSLIFLEVQKVRPNQRNVVEKTTTTTDHHQQSTTTVVVVLVSLEVFGEMIYALRQESNLHFRRTGVGAMSTVFGNGFNLGDASHG